MEGKNPGEIPDVVAIALSAVVGARTALIDCRRRAGRDLRRFENRIRTARENNERKISASRVRGFSVYGSRLIVALCIYIVHVRSRP